MRTGRRDFSIFPWQHSLAQLRALRRTTAADRRHGRRVASVQAKPKQSGRPFDAHFVDVAAAAGLVAPVVYGGVDRKEFIIEANGCGCAFLDYDNDGWLDIFF